MNSELIIGGILTAGLAVGGFLLHSHGEASGRAEVQAKWNAASLLAERTLTKALRERDALRDSNDRLLQENEHASLAAKKALESSSLATRREHQRLRDALASAAVDRRELSAAPATSPEPDGRAALAFELFGECTGELVALGDEAGKLALQATGLRAYAGVAVKACGSGGTGGAGRVGEVGPSLD